VRIRNPTDKQLWSRNFTNGWPRGAPNGVTIHTMEGWFDPSVAWLRNPQAQASAHFCVRRDGYIVQLVRQNDRAWHARTSGMFYFGIEHEGGSNVGPLEALWKTGKNADQLRDDDHMLIQSAKLVAFLCNKWNIRIQHDFGPVRRDTTSHIAGHNQMAGNDHVDPGPDFPWQAYMNKVQQFANGG
jgi:N-acetyl-anhydromuramyl-L-alanine amidase AmpD